MIKYSNEPKLDRWFGEFGGSFCINDTGNLRYGHPEIEYLEAVKTDLFEQNLRKVLAVIVPEIRAKEIKLSNGGKATIVPRYGKKYNVAGHVALALTLGKKQLYVGTYSEEVVLDLLKIVPEFNMKLKIVMGDKLSEKNELISKLEEINADVDSKTSSELFDMPYAYLLPPFMDPLPGMVITDTANYNDYPAPALAGLLSSIYGEDIKKIYGTNFDAITVPTVEGTNALSLIKPYINDSVDKITVEETICQEYYGIDHDCYTVIARRSDYDEMNITLCPELVNYWRTTKVIRLGAGRVKKVDLSTLEKEEISDLTKKAIILAQEYGNYKNMLVMEAE